MGHLYDTFDASKIVEVVAWVVIIFAAVTLSMGVDLVTGIRKARQRGEATTSKAMRKTVDKACKYYMPMLCTTCVDVMASVLMQFPVFTALIGGFNCLCEFWSVFESTHTKAEIKETGETVKVIVKNEKNLAQSIAEVLEMKIKEGVSNGDADN